MNKTIIKTLSIVIIIIFCFVVSFVIGLNILESNTEKIEGVQENSNTQTSEANLLENLVTNSDIEATKRNSFVGIIAEVDIDNKQITVENPSHLIYHEIYHGDTEWRSSHKVIIDGEIYVKAGYLLCLDNVPIKDYNGNKMEASDLKAGDTINVSTRNVEYVSNIIFESLTSDNIVLIERKK